MDPVHASTSSEAQLMRQRGGRKVTPLRIAQLLITAGMLIGASVLFILYQFSIVPPLGVEVDLEQGARTTALIFGYVLTAAAAALSFLEVRE